MAIKLPISSREAVDTGDKCPTCGNPMYRVDVVWLDPETGPRDIGSVVVCQVCDEEEPRFPSTPPV